MRIYFLVIFLALATGFFYGVCTDPDAYYESYDDFFHDTFSGCPCIKEKRRGQETLEQLRPVGKSTEEIVALAGHPCEIQTRSAEPTLLEQFFVGPVNKSDAAWFYPTIFLHIKGGRCIRAYPRMSICHWGAETMEHALICQALRLFARSQGIPDLSMATGN